MRRDLDETGEIGVCRAGLNKLVELVFRGLNQAGVGKFLLEFIDEPGPVVEERGDGLLQMVEPFNGDPIAKIKRQENNLVIVGREADGVELNDPVDFAKEGCNLLMFAGKHPGIPDFDR